MNYQNKIDEYYSYKWLISIIFNTDDNSYLRKSNLIFDVRVLESLKRIIEVYTKEGYFNKTVKNNIYTLLVNARFFKDDKIKERVDLVNDMTTYLNQQYDDKSEIFYRDQLYRRTRETKYLFKYSKEQIEILSEYVNQQLYNDFIIIKSHGDEYTEEQFDKLYLNDFIDLDVYYENINFILEECPYLFVDKIFYNRVIKVLNSNSKEFDKKTNSVKKRIKRSIKKIKPLKV